MATVHPIRLTVTLFALTLWLGGCSPSTQQTPEAQQADPAHDHAGDDHAGHDHGQDEIEQAMSKLTAEDRSLAEAQKVCLVSGEALGSMGTPTKLDVKGEAIFICCDGCKSAVEEEPDKYLAKLQGSNN